MQGAGGQFLANPGLALQQHIDIGRGQLAQGSAQALHHRSLADQGPVVLGLGGQGAQLAVLQHQASLFESPPDAGDQPLGRIGLGDEVVDAVVHGLHRLGDIGMAGDQDDGQVAVLVLEPAKQLAAVHARHADVADHHARKAGRQDAQRGFSVGEGQHLKAGQLQRLHIGVAQHVVVVDEGHLVDSYRHH